MGFLARLFRLPSAKKAETETDFDRRLRELL